MIPPKRPRAYKDVEGELSTFVSNIKVTVSPDGTVMLRKSENDEDGSENKEPNDETVENVNNDNEEKDSESDRETESEESE